MSLTSLEMTVKSLDPVVREAARQAFITRAGDQLWTDDDDSDLTLYVGAGEVRGGTIHDLVADLRALIVKHGEFAFSVNEDPYGEWLGSGVIHVPGVGDFSGMVDMEGAVLVTATEVERVLAAHPPEELTAAFDELLGTPVTAAFYTYLPAAS